MSHAAQACGEYDTAAVRHGRREPLYRLAVARDAVNQDDQRAECSRTYQCGSNGAGEVVCRRLCRRPGEVRVAKGVEQLP